MREYSADALAFYKSKKWKDCRASYIARRRAIDGGLCERCHDRLGYIVHHKVYIDALTLSNQSVTLNHDNLEFVCKPCHDIEHFIPSEKKLLCHFNAKGWPINASTTERDEN